MTFITNYFKMLWQITTPSLQTTTKSCYKLRNVSYKLNRKLLLRFYYKFRPENNTNYNKNLLKIMATQICPSSWWLLKIVLIFIANYRSFQNYSKLRQKAVQITQVLQIAALLKITSKHSTVVLNFKFLAKS